MLSHYQTALKYAVKDPVGADVLIVDAKAGSGKTFTLREVHKEMTGTSIFLAFNKAIAHTLKGYGLNASTMHGLGLKACAQGGRFRINSYKGNDVAQSLGIERQESQQMKRLNGLGRAHLFLPETKQQLWDEVVDHFDITISAKAIENGFWNNFHRFYAGMFDTTHGIDFDDMVSLPIYKNWAIPQYDWVMVDECQDLNPGRKELVFRAMKHRAIFVGDPNQAIYGFTGAMHDSMDQIAITAKERQKSLQKFPLSICYRCSQAVIVEAQKTVPDIEAAPDAVEGSVSTIEMPELKNTVVAGDAILGRTIAPLVKVCFDLIRCGKRAMVKGREIGEDLINMVDRVAGRSTVSTAKFLEELDAFKIKEVERLTAAKREMQAEAFVDKCETLLVLSEGADNIYDLKKKITDIFADDIPSNTILCSSLHNAKGLEWDTVYIIRPDLIPHPNAKKEWQAQQEHNLKYVGVTRARINLKWVNGK